MNISTKFAGLILKSPVIVSSSGLTGTVAKFREFEENGAGAIVLKSLFEEEIHFEYDQIVKEAGNDSYSQEDLDYFDLKIRQDNINKYISLIQNAKKEVSIPVIASINCSSLHEWTNFTQKIEQAGADALELNIFTLPSDISKDARDIEDTYFKIIEKVKKNLGIPLVIKMSSWFTNLSAMIKNVSETGIDGLVLFNRFFMPDIDIRAKRITSAGVFSSPADLTLPLRWIALSAGRVSCPLAASTGVHDGESLVKMILVGADAVEIASTLYKNGSRQIREMNEFLAAYMKDENADSLQDIKGILSQKNVKNPAIFERVQFMKYFSDRTDN